MKTRQLHLKSTGAPLLLLTLLAALAPACRTTEKRRPHYSSEGVIRRAQPARAWTAQLEGQPVGELIFFESATHEGDSHYIVRNRWQQDLGVIDSLGRAYRYMPHSEEPVWVGTGTVLQGAERILDAEGKISLSEVPLPAAQAAGAPREAQHGAERPSP